MYGNTIEFSCTCLRIFYKHHILQDNMNMRNKMNVITSKHLSYVITISYCLSTAVVISPLGYSMPVHVLAQRIADICQVR